MAGIAGRRLSVYSWSSWSWALTSLFYLDGTISPSSRSGLYAHASARREKRGPGHLSMASPYYPHDRLSEAYPDLDVLSASLSGTGFRRGYSLVGSHTGISLDVDATRPGRYANAIGLIGNVLLRGPQACCLPHDLRSSSPCSRLSSIQARWLGSIHGAGETEAHRADAAIGNVTDKIVPHLRDNGSNRMSSYPRANRSVLIRLPGNRCPCFRRFPSNRSGCRQADRSRQPFPLWPDGPPGRCQGCPGLATHPDRLLPTSS